MKFRLYKEYGALNSGPVFSALEEGIKKLGHQITHSNEDISVIWSVLWHGRMSHNKFVFDRCRNTNKKILILEVGNLKRGVTWRLSLNHVNRNGIFGNQQNLQPSRPSTLGLTLKEINNNRKDEILIACQHDRSLQWERQPPMVDWLNATIETIKNYSNRSVLVRPHPRCPLQGKVIGAEVIQPKKVQGSYDDFDIDYGYHCVINFNSGPAIQAAINGTPIICDTSSLAHDISDKLKNIEKISLPDRQEWFLKLCHTEWTIDEIKTGEPLQRILDSTT